MSLTSISKNIWQTQSRLSVQSNHLIFKQFEDNWQDENVLRTHLFDGRYENIYLNEQHIPELSPLIEEATQLAAEILKVKNLRAGY